MTTRPGRVARALGLVPRPAVPSGVDAVAGTPPASVPPVEVDQIITCIDCGGRAHLVSYPPEERDWEPGDLIVYRCEDCLDRWDLVVPDDDADGP